MDVSLKFRDSTNWTDIDSKVTNWSNDAQRDAGERTQPEYLPPDVVFNVWNGIKHDVQHIRRKGWYLEFNIKESEVHKISELQSCDIITIKDSERLIHTADMQSSDFMNISYKRISNTSNWKVKLIYRTNKQVINKFSGLGNEVTVNGSGTYYSKYEKVVFDDGISEIKIPWNDGEVLLESTNKTGFKCLFYMTNAEKETFKNDYKTNDFTIDATTVLEKRELEITELGEDNYSIIATFITAKTTTDQTSGLSNVVTLNSAGGNFYSKFPAITYVSPKDEIRVQWDDEVESLLHETNRVGQRVLMYMSGSMFELFQSDWNQLNYTIGAVPIVEKQDLEIAILDSGNVQIYVNCITSLESVDKTSSLSVVTQLLRSGIPYSSMFSKLPLISESEIIQIRWDEGIDTVLRESNNIGYRILLYLNSTDMETFKNYWNTNEFYLDADEIIIKLPLEITILKSDYYQIIVSCVISKHSLLKWGGITLAEIQIGSSFYTTPLASKKLDIESEKISIKWPDGSERLLREINKKGVKLFYYYNQADMYTFKNDFREGSVVLLPSTPVLEKLPLKMIEDEYGYFQITASIVTSVNLEDYDLSPLNTHNIDINSGTFYYTDYATEVSYEIDTDTIDNENGVNVVSKSISKKVVNVKLFMNEADMASFKNLFETSNDIEVDGVPVLENREVEINKLGYDLYEVDAECVTVVTINYPL